MLWKKLMLIAIFAAGNSASSVAAPMQTNVILLSPWNFGILRKDLTVTKQDTGSCWTQSLASNRPDAWRCSTDQVETNTIDGHSFRGTMLYDPCFAGAQNQVACFPDAFAHHVVLLTLTKPLPAAEERGGAPQPWALRLNNGARCRLVTGATGVVAGMRLNYGCDNEAWVLGTPDRSSEPWKVYYIKSPQDSNVKQVGVATAIL